MVLWLGIWLLIMPYAALALDLQSFEVFIKRIDPSLFDWTLSSSSKGFQFRASLANKPDLPSWLSYIYSDRHKAGFIFGVPPSNQNSFNIDVIGLNRETYETRHKVIHLNITEKRETAKYEVHMKIDNLNVQDMFDPHRLQKLLNVFTQTLWKSSKDDLYVTFLESAVKMGGRLPLRPQEGEGVILHIGSQEEFSEELLNLQEEIRPLYKLTNCPRDLKRTTVNVHFTTQGFLLDWCKFRLVKIEGESGNAHYKEIATGGGGGTGGGVFGRLDWDLPDARRLPLRDYSSEALLTLVVPLVTLISLWAFLSFILCVQHDSVSKKLDDDHTIAQYEAVQRATDTLRSMDNNRNTEPSPLLTSECMDTCRPSPPPYSAIKRMISDS